MPLRIGTRASVLARWQAEWVAAQLRNRGIEVELTPISTTGDRRQAAIDAIGSQGVFTKEIQQALLDCRIDLAVHSLKDLPTAVVPGLTLAAVPERGPVADVLVLGPGVRGQGSEKRLNAEPWPLAPGPYPLPPLPPGAAVGTGSPRRRAQLLRVRPDLRMKDIRGNVETRLRKLQQGDFDAIVLAEAGLRRLEEDEGVGSLCLWDHYEPGQAHPLHRVGLNDGDKDSRPLCFVLPLKLVLPAVGQGALALEARADDLSTCGILAALDHPPTHAAVLAERAMLTALQGGCLAPVAALGCITENQLTLTGRVIGRDGVEMLEATQSTKLPSPYQPSVGARRGVGGEGEVYSTAQQLGRQVAELLLLQGAGELIEASRKP